MKTSIGILCNDREKLKNCFLQSPKDSIHSEVRIAFDAESAPKGLNKLLKPIEAEGYDAAIFVHQDVVLFSEWQKKVEEQLSKIDNWGVAGVWGVKGLKFYGNVWDARLPCGVCSGGHLPREVHTLDEICLIIRCGIGFNFNEEMIGWNLYGSYASLWARSKGYGVWVLNAPIYHNTSTPFDWEPDEIFIRNWSWLSEKFPLDQVCSTVCDEEYIKAIR